MFATYVPQTRTHDNDLTEAGLNRLTDLLLRLHHDFDYVDEEALAEAAVDGGRLRVGEEEFELVLVPPMTHVRLSTVEALERFASAGGRVLGVLSTPRTAFGHDGTLVDIGARFDSLVGTDGEVQEHDGGGLGAFVPGDAGVVLDGAAAAAPLAEGLHSAIALLIEPDVEISNEEVFCVHRVREGRELYFVVNPTKEAQRARMSISGDASPLLWDPSTGQERPATAVDRDGSRTSFDLNLPPVGSVFVLTAEPDVGGDGRGAMAPHEASPRRDNEAVVVDGPWTFEAEDDNALLITAWRAADERDGASAASYASGPIDGGWWLPVVAGAWSFQLPAEPDRPFPIPVWFRASFEVTDTPERLALILDGLDGSDVRVHLNGTTVDADRRRSRFDAQMKELDLSPHLRTGTNELAIRLVVERNTGGIVDHLKLVGTFAIDGDAEKGYRIIAPRSGARPAPWTEQGYPFYSGTGVYRARFDAPPVGDGERAVLEVPMGDDVVEAEVNGRSAGVRLWDPYAFDVTDLLLPGENEIALRVANTIANLLNGVDRPSGIAGAPKLVAVSSKARVGARQREA
jgi:hypothetical protein